MMNADENRPLASLTQGSKTAESDDSYFSLVVALRETSLRHSSLRQAQDKQDKRD